jgi:outer membrane biosynthesis protein TonB
MTRTDVMASSRPQAQSAARVRGGSFSGWRRLIVLPVMLLLAVALVAPMSAAAASTTTNKEGLTGYEKKPEEKSGTTETKTPATQTTPPTKTTPPTQTTPPTSNGTSPTTETKTPKAETAPTSTSSTPSSSTSPSSETAKATTLPFTGLDLRWMIGLGLLLSGAGVSIVTVQRRHRRDG